MGINLAFFKTINSLIFLTNTQHTIRSLTLRYKAFIYHVFFSNRIEQPRYNEMKGKIRSQAKKKFTDRGRILRSLISSMNSCGSDFNCRC